MRDVGVGTHTFVNVSPLAGHFKNSDVDVAFLWEILVGYGKVIALGGIASRVLTKMGVAHFRMPHPSGRNRQLNDRSFERKKLRELRKWLDGG